MDEDGGRIPTDTVSGLAGYFVATAYNLVWMANLVSCERARALQWAFTPEWGHCARKV